MEQYYNRLGRKLLILTSTDAYVCVDDEALSDIVVYVYVYANFTGPCGIGTKALPDAAPLEKGMILSDG